MYSRRQILLATGGLGVAVLAGGLLKHLNMVTEVEAAETFEVTHTEAQWRSLLSAEQFAVLREEGTERPYTSPLNDEHRTGAHRHAENLHWHQRLAENHISRERGHRRNQIDQSRDPRHVAMADEQHQQRDRRK